MTPIQTGVLIFEAAVITVAWLKGGHPERRGASTILLWDAAAIASPAWLQLISVGEIMLFQMALELAVLVVFFRMALKGGRWWPFVASAVMTLSVLVFLVPALVPGFDRRAEISAHVGLAAALDLTLLAGVAERWLAGERPVSRDRWRLRTTSP